MAALPEPEVTAYQELPASSGKRWEAVTVSAKLRMKLNGESEEQVAHAKAIKEAGGVSLPESFGPDTPEERKRDTSSDQDWHIDNSDFARRSDCYVLVTTFLWLGPKILIFALPMLACHVLPMALIRLYMSVLPDKTFQVSRSKSFYVVFTFTLMLALPAAVLIVLSYILDYIAYYFFCLLFCTCTCRWRQAMASLKKIQPYRNGPSVVLHLTDLFVALVGQTSRQTVCETTYMVSCMWLLMPWLKYYINCNPWIYDLGHRLCQQISTEMADLKGPDNVADTARYIISCTREDRNTADRIDIWSFVPHYPFPPPDRRWALGLQAGGTQYPGKFTLIVHTTHAIQSVRGVTEQFVLSNSCEQPIYRVMLWYNNPFHFLTGWVEASVSTGMPSQPDKALGGEHPMWLVTGHSPQVAGRSSFTGSGMIDAYFDYWLPAFVHEMRYQVLGLEEADKKYQEVISQDLASPPQQHKGRDSYKRAGLRTALSDFKLEAKKQDKEEGQKIGRVVARLAETRAGQWVAQRLQSEDIHREGGPMEGWSSLSHTVRSKAFSLNC